MLACTTIGFQPYTEKQLRNILVARAKAAGFCKYKAPVPVTATSLTTTPTSEESPVITSSSSSSTTAAVPVTVTSAPDALFSSVPSVTTAAAAAAVFSTDPTLTAIPDFSNDLDAFAAVMLVALPQLTMKSRHVRDLWETSMALWGLISYTSNPSLFIYASVPCAAAATTTSATAVESGVSAPPAFGTASSSSTSTAAPLPAVHVNAASTERFQINFKAVKEAAQQVLLLPATHAIKVQMSKQKRTRGNVHDSAHNIRIAKLERHSNVSKNSINGLRNGITACQPELLQAIPEDIHSFVDNNLSKSIFSSNLTAVLYTHMTFTNA